jgi:hypothetical protein
MHWRCQFKEDLQAETCIKKADPSGRLNVQWKRFLDQYDNPVSKIKNVMLRPGKDNGNPCFIYGILGAL